MISPPLVSSRRAFTLFVFLLASIATASWCAPAAHADRYALLVGVQNYGASELSSLKYTGNDVVELGSALRDAGYKLDNVVVMTEILAGLRPQHKPTLANIRHELARLVDRCEKDDTLIIALAGHGVQFRNSEDSFFCPQDAKLSDQASLLPIGEVYAQLRKCKASMKLLFVDACRDEILDANRAVRVVNLDETAAARNQPPPEGSAVFYSCSSGQRAFEDASIGHGVFFNYLIQGIRGAADLDKDRRVDLPDLEKYVIRNTLSFSKANQLNPQTPELMKRSVGITPVVDLTSRRAGFIPAEAAPAGLKLSQQLGINNPQAPVIEGVFPQRDSDIQVQPGDVILTLNGQAIRTPEKLTKIIESYTPGETVTVDVLRDGKKQQVKQLIFPYPQERELVDRLRKRAEAGVPWAEFTMGVVSALGRGVRQDGAVALKWFEKAAKQGHARGQHHLGMWYEGGIGVKVDYREAARWHRRSALQGYAPAQVSLGNLYLNGQGVDEDRAEAFRLYKLAAEQELPIGQLSLATMYVNGLGTAVDNKEAFRLALAAANQGLAEAQNQVGYYYSNGIGTPVDHELAVAWFRKAIDQDSPHAMVNLGFAHEMGYGVPPDKREAFRWTLRAANRGNAGAQSRVGTMYLNGTGVEADADVALQWLRKSAAQEDSWSMTHIGNMYATGNGVEKDDREALRWFRKAAALENPMAENMLGVFYYNGRAVPRDLTEAIRWYRKAAKQNSGWALFNLAELYLQGEGVNADRQEGLRLMTQAAATGNQEAKKRLAILEGRNPPAGGGNAGMNNPPANANLPKDAALVAYNMAETLVQQKKFTQAVPFYEQAAQAGHAEAQYSLGVCYRRSLGVKANFTVAYQWFEKAAAQGHGNAAYETAEACFFGRGVEKDYDKAVKIFSAAALKGNAACAYGLGICYLTGRGLAQNDSKAFSWILYSAKKGYPSAQYDVAHHYANGRGVEANPDTALDWIQRAAKSGHPTALQMVQSTNDLEQILEQMRR